MRFDFKWLKISLIDRLIFFLLLHTYIYKSNKIQIYIHY